MYPSELSQSNLESLSQFTNSYTNLVFKMVQQNLEQAELLHEKLMESVFAALPGAIEPEEPAEAALTEIEQLRLQVKELEALKEQVAELNRKYAVLENRTRSGRWNKTGTGHFKKT